MWVPICGSYLSYLYCPVRTILRCLYKAGHTHIHTSDVWSLEAEGATAWRGVRGGDRRQFYGRTYNTPPCFYRGRTKR